MHSATKLPSDSIPSSPSLSLANFDYDSDASAEQKSHHTCPPLPSPLPTRETNVASPFIVPDTREDPATKSDITELQTLIRQQVAILRNQISTTPVVQALPPEVSVPETAFADTLRAELALQMAKVSVLEEEVRRLRGEKQALRTELERVENSQPVHAQLNAANSEMQHLYVERQGLWDERADLWRERQSLWDERGELWKERGELWKEREELWVVRDKLMEQVQSSVEGRDKPEA
ncbi:hypothetical protein FRC12_007025 [Ceratobasidium sp. 428]|nr:hypothetical protein FRC12_007025 [Ceratobasidium sp. 428]